MNRVLQSVITVGVVSLACVATVALRGPLRSGRWADRPLSDYKNVDKVGWHATLNANFAIPMSPSASAWTPVRPNQPQGFRHDPDYREHEAHRRHRQSRV